MSIQSVWHTSNVGYSTLQEQILHSFFFVESYQLQLNHSFATCKSDFNANRFNPKTAYIKAATIEWNQKELYWNTYGFASSQSKSKLLQLQITESDIGKSNSLSAPYNGFSRKSTASARLCITMFVTRARNSSAATFAWCMKLISVQIRTVCSNYFLS